MIGNFFIDEHGFPRAHFERPYEVLGYYLEQDVQSCIASCDTLIEICKQVESGLLASWSGTGNAHSIEILPDKVQIEKQYSIQPEGCVILISEFKSAVSSWKKLVSKKDK
jgi:hypothetical protein